MANNEPLKPDQLRKIIKSLSHDEMEDMLAFLSGYDPDGWISAYKFVVER